MCWNEEEKRSKNYDQFLKMGIFPRRRVAYVFYV